ncbi:MAG TPA: short chain dehydrogenase, partial [Solirubrobacteraceae bacterium]|nr:short chain dehydrogenase [Solirubrobacteraceae bacterium]
NAFARVAGAPRIAASVGGRPAAWATTRGTRALSRLPVVGTPVRALLAEAGIPEEVLAYLGFTARFDTIATQESLAGSGVGVPPLDSYAKRLWDYWEANLRELR